VKKNGGSIARSVDVVVEMRTVASRIPPHDCPRQGRQRPTPRYCAAGEVIALAYVAAYGLNDNYECPQGRQRLTPRYFAAFAGGVRTVESRQRRCEATANDPNSPNVHRRVGFLVTAQIRPVMFFSGEEHSAPL
jgi:hypothetical protein